MRGWLSRLIFGFMVLLGLVLIEAHYEMNQTAPPVPPIEQLAAVSGGTDGPVRLRYINSGTQIWPGGDRGTYGGFLLEWADGRAFAIDVGMTKPVAVEFGASLELLGAGPVRALGSMAEVLRTDARRIEGVGISHLHYDHPDGMGLLCKVHPEKLPVYQVPLQYRRGNFSTLLGEADLEEADCVVRIQLLDGPLYDIPGFPGLAAFPVGGHTPGSTIFVANVAGTRWVFAGDVTNNFQNLLDDVAKPLAYSVFLIPENRTRLHQLRIWLAEINERPEFEVLVAHDLDRIAEAGIEIVPR